MEENKPIKDLKDILAKVESEAPAPVPPPQPSVPEADVKQENTSFIERTKIESIVNQLQASPSDTVTPQEILPLLIEADDAAQTPQAKILAELIKQKKI